MSFRTTRGLLLACALLTVTSIAISADSDTPPPAGSAPASEKTKTETPPAWPDCNSLPAKPNPSVRVTSAEKLTPGARQSGMPGQSSQSSPAGKPTPAGKSSQAANKVTTIVSLHDSLVLTVQNLDWLRRHQECTAGAAQKKPIVLYLNEYQLADIEAEPSVNPEDGKMIFPLRRTETSRQVWTDLLGKPGWGSRKIGVSLGLKDEFAVPSDAVVDLTPLPKGWLTFWLVLLVIVGGWFVKMARTTSLLRDSINSTAVDRNKPWSLSRLQAAWWFFLVLASYLFIGCVTGDYSTTITGTVLVLLGIAAGTTVISTGIDDGKDTPESRVLEQAAITKLETEIAALETDTNTLATKIAAGTATDQEKVDHPAKLQELQAKRSQLKKQLRETEGLRKDILSDANGVNFHRFQIATWTLVLGIVFVCAVYRDLAMPQFSETLLGLMGLSAGTFVAMKNTEAEVPKK